MGKSSLMPLEKLPSGSRGSPSVLLNGSTPNLLTCTLQQQPHITSIAKRKRWSIAEDRLRCRSVKDFALSAGRKDSRGTLKGGRNATSGTALCPAPCPTQSNR